MTGNIANVYKLKEYSVILTTSGTTSFNDINQKILRKKVISKISVDSSFPLASYGMIMYISTA